MCVQKEEMGEVLHEVDFNQLRIENQQYLEKIDERNQDLLRLKQMTGSTTQVLNSYKVGSTSVFIIQHMIYLLHSLLWSQTAITLTVFRQCNPKCCLLLCDDAYIVYAEKTWLVEVNANTSVNRDSSGW